MTAEPLGKNTYKVILDKTEAEALPSEDDSKAMRSYICQLIDLLAAEYSIEIPEGKLLTEVFLRSDGSCVFFITALEQEQMQRKYYSCDVHGMEQLRALCHAIAESGIRSAVYCDDSFLYYRLIFTEPPQLLSQLCSEYGDYCEISHLFALRSEEYLTELMPCGDIRRLCELLG